jgi:hypothetical protein
MRQPRTPAVASTPETGRREILSARFDMGLRRASRWPLTARHVMRVADNCGTLGEVA